MKKLVKTALITTFSLFACSMIFATGNGNVETQTANAETAVPATFEMVKGAAIKDSKDKVSSGMSFMAKVPADTKASIKFVIAPKNYVDNYSLDIENLFGETAKYYKGDNKIDGELNENGQLEIWWVNGVFEKTEGGFDYYRASIVDFNQANLEDDAYTTSLLREYVGRAYIENGKEYTMANYYGGQEANNTRSMAMVARLAMLDKSWKPQDEKTFTETYLTESVNNTATKVTTEYYKNGVKQEDTSVPVDATMGTATATITPDAKKYDGYENPTVTYSAAEDNGFLAQVNYTPIEYTIAYTANMGGDKFTHSNPSTYTIEDEEITLKNASLADHNHLGWWNGEKFVTKIETGTTGNISLEAVIKPKDPETISLFTRDDFNGERYETEYAIPYKGIQSIELSSPSEGETIEDYFTIEPDYSKMTAKAYSENTETALITLKNSTETNPVKIWINFTLTRPVWTIEEEVKLFDATKGKVIVEGTGEEKSIASLFEGADFTTVSFTNITATEVVEGGSSQPLNYSEGVLSDVPVTTTREMVKQKITFENATEVYEVTVCPSTKVLTTMDEIKSTFINTSTAQTVEGYYTLAKDIVNENFVTVGSGNKNKFIGVFDGNGKTISKLDAGINGLFGDINPGMIKNIAFTDVKLSNAGNAGSTLLGRFQNTAALENVYIKMSHEPCYRNNGSLRPVSVLSKANIPNTVKMTNVVIDSSAYTILEAPTGTVSETNPRKDRTYSHYSPFGGVAASTGEAFMWWTGSPGSYTVAESAVTKLEQNQQNVYFITSDYLYQYCTNVAAATDDVRILDAANRKGDVWDASKVGGVAQADACVAYVETFYRYETAAEMAEATKKSDLDLSAFTNTGMWEKDAAQGLIWVGNADPDVA